MADAVRDYFVPSYLLVVHWDGKILPEMLEGINVERWPFLVSEDGNKKLLGVF